MNPWLSAALAIAGGLVLAWLLALAALMIVKPRGGLLTEAIRLLPDLLRLIPRLARDPQLPRGVRVRLWLLLGYLAMPIDLIPDFIPVLGYADDAIVVAATLRSVVRAAGPEALTRHWPGTPDGLTAVRRLAGLPRVSPPGAQDRT
ncbi:YkvA family protein [Streptomyces scopuliridis]|uniref:YkvA family protein n=1 Tax=Streptomyces scopuliridis TaxID=452529 RepID=UPI0036915541